MSCTANFHSTINSINCPTFVSSYIPHVAFLFPDFSIQNLFLFCSRFWFTCPKGASFSFTVSLFPLFRRVIALTHFHSVFLWVTVSVLFSNQPSIQVRSLKHDACVYQLCVGFSPLFLVEAHFPIKNASFTFKAHFITRSSSRSSSFSSILFYHYSFPLLELKAHNAGLLQNEGVAVILIKIIQISPLS